ncbi:hypothetical protein LTR17_018611 [Elasticomyces elasticus]|nr:hypothetical protein LTR17_018611 [Elasticomyces elasticus]
MSFPSPTRTYHTEAYAAIDPALPALSSKGKNVVISGGGSGIGPKIAKAYAISGASTIALLGRTEKTLLSTKNQVESVSPGTKCYFYVADVVDNEAVKRSLADHAAAVGSLHVLVSFEHLMKVFLHGPEALPHLHSVTDWALMQWLSPEAVGGGRFSPGLTYGILGMPSAGLQMTLRQPLSDILPYLTNQTSELARVLY